MATMSQDDHASFLMRTNPGLAKRMGYFPQELGNVQPIRRQRVNLLQKNAAQVSQVNAFLVCFL